MRLHVTLYYMRGKLTWVSAYLATIMVTFSGCTTAYRQSIGAHTEEVYTRIFLTDFDTAWQAVLDALKSYRLDVSNRESGFIETKWTDNTAERNFVDSFAGAQTYLKSQYRFRTSVSRGFYDGKPSVKVSVQKDQVVQHDVLEGWTTVDTDSIEENTLLYRIGRIVYVRTKIAKLEEEKTKKAIENSKF